VASVKAVMLDPEGNEFRVASGELFRLVIEESSYWTDAVVDQLPGRAWVCPKAKGH